MFTDRLIKISVKYFIRGGVIQTLMGFDRVVKVNEAHQLDMAVLSVLEYLLAMPHVHQGTDDPFRLAVGLWTVDAGELLADALLFAGLDEGMPVSPPVFLAVVRVGIVKLVRALGDHVVGEEAGGTVLGLVGQDVGIQLTGEVVNGDKQVFPGLGGRLALKQRQPLGVEMDQLARIGLVVAPRLAFQALLDGLFDLGEAFEAVLDRLKALVGAVAGRKFP